jgi:hypothetical protein
MDCAAPGGLVRVRHASRELHGCGLADDDRAGRAQAGDHRRVTPVAPGGVEHQALGGGRRVVGGDDVLDPQRDALQRAFINAAGKIRIGSRGLRER